MTEGKNKNGEKREKTGGKKEKRLMEIVATTSLPAVDRPNADRWNAARSRQNDFLIICIQIQSQKKTASLCPDRAQI